MKTSITTALIIILTGTVNANDIERFEHFNTRNGLSQNNVLSIFCDNKGFLWLGTMDGLNRYDGYNFKIFKSAEGQKNKLTNNRISKIWEDSLNFIWVKTYEGYYHYLEPSKEEFITYPNYLKSIEEKNSVINCFLQAAKNEIWLGSSNSGAYHLVYNPLIKKYSFSQYISRGVSSISNNTVNFIIRDNDENIWLGTERGLNFLHRNERSSISLEFKHFYANYQFTSAAILNQYIYISTKNNGIILYNQQTKSFDDAPEILNSLKKSDIKALNVFKNYFITISTSNDGLFIYNPTLNSLIQYNDQGTNIRSVYFDKEGMIWVITENFGINKINSINNTEKHYSLTPKELKPLIDDERLFIYEDNNGDLWIGSHGAGLALYDRINDNFNFYRNTPNFPGTISSNFVHCMTEDKSGLLWVGTGQFNGGINKIVRSSTAFKQIILKTNVEELSDNVVRSLYQDSNGFIWMATKSGEIYVYNKNLSYYKKLKNIINKNRTLPGFNIYSILEDSDGYIWLGSKGGGVLVSKDPLNIINNNYDKLDFNIYQNIPNDTISLSSNFVYSIIEDDDHTIWISTYGGGINKVLKRNNRELQCQVFNLSNSNISSDEVRYLYEDHENNIWIGTTFGLNLLTGKEKKREKPQFISFLYNPEKPQSLSYNDVIHIYEDSRNRIWLGTFGGGLNLIKKDNNNQISFKHYNKNDGLTNDAVFAITEDQYGKIWLSTEKGISVFNPENETFENYDLNSGLYAENYSENTCLRTNRGYLLFGSTKGTLIIYPDRMEKSQYAPPVVITQLQLSNRDINFNDENAPIHSSIETLNSIHLKYFQSSFSFEYAALSYFAPDQNEYMFILENFDKEWNIVGNQRKATYTNIPPGEYIFKVKGANWDGTWNEEPVAMHITISPPWWKSTLAFIIYIVLSGLILWIAYTIFLNYYKLHNDLLVERRVNDIKLQFFTNISHEIRTPLTLILGPIQDIKSIKRLPVQLLQRIEIMERNAKRMLRLINQLLDFRKIQKEKMALSVREVNLIQFIKEISEHFNPIARQKHINFEFVSEINELPVYIDIRKFDSVIFNVLSNAFKYSPVEKTIKLEVIKNDADYVNIIISDQGPGIPQENLGVLFQRFTTINTGSEVFEGSGIGLNLSYEIMQLHHGNITVESKLNEGSVFTIKLPLGKNHFRPEEFKTGESSKKPEYEIIEAFDGNETFDEKEIVDSEKKKILIVEDNAEIISYLKSILKSSYIIKSALHGKDALKILTSYHPEIIITDIMMPEMDGISFTKHIKSNIETSHIPVIMLTAKSGIEDQIMGVESGAESYLQKPFNADLLKAVITNILTQRENILKRYSEKDYFENIEVKVTAKDDEFMQNIVSIIEKNYHNPEFNVEKLVEISTVSRTLMYNKLKGLTGISPVEFIRQMRLRYAATILKELGRGVSETAYLTGFNDIKYFRKCFKEMFGMSPKEYKQMDNITTDKDNESLDD